jgi:hypothetical protein
MFYNKMIFISISLTSYYYLIISVQQTILKKPLVNSCCLLLMSFFRYISRFIFSKHSYDSKDKINQGKYLHGGMLFYSFISIVSFICLRVSCFSTTVFIVVSGCKADNCNYSAEIINYSKRQTEKVDISNSKHHEKIRCGMKKNLMLDVFSTHAT